MTAHDDSVSRTPPIGLTSTEAAKQLVELGPNEMAEAREHPLLRALRHFWAPVPWMLEITILLQLVAGERLEAAMVAILLLINVALAIVQEGRASATLALLRQRLAPAPGRAGTGPGSICPQRRWFRVTSFSSRSAASCRRMPDCCQAQSYSTNQC